MYNGHKNWNHWNVSLWLSNEEFLYTAMMRAIRSCNTKDGAARKLYRDLVEFGITKTPDGVPYSVTSIRAAMREF